MNRPFRTVGCLPVASLSLANATAKLLKGSLTAGMYRPGRRQYWVSSVTVDSKNKKAPLVSVELQVTAPDEEAARAAWVAIVAAADQSSRDIESRCVNVRAYCVGDPR